MIKLYQKSSTGKIKFIELSTNNAEFITTWGLLGGKTQTSTKVCVGMNVGKSNETTPEQQAILEMEAKATLKKKEGYVELLEQDNTEVSVTDIDLDNLPKNLCPNKPISKMPDKIANASGNYGQRKHNGHCLILVHGKTSHKVYTRRMEEITPYVKDLPVIKEALEALPKESFLIYECVYYSNTYNKEMPRFVAQVITKEDAAEAFNRYNELSKSGTYSMIPLDALYLDGVFIGNKTHLQRKHLLANKNINSPELLYNWKDLVETAKKDNWEGFIIRLNDSSSHIGFTMDGKAKRAGGWKYKFVSEDDFVIDRATKGISGKHSNFYAKFHIIQYDSKGNVIDRGYVGPGTLTHDELETLTQKLDSGAKTFPIVAEIEYQSIHDESGKVEFGVIQRLREDKVPSECICDD